MPQIETYFITSYNYFYDKFEHDFFRRAGSYSKSERGIFVKHFNNIPMADMEIVLVSYLNY